MAILLAICLLALSSQNAPAEASTDRTAPVTASLLSATAPQRVYIVLRSQNLATDAASRSSALTSAAAKQTNRARIFAGANPYLFTEQERRAAQSIERIRTLEMKQLRGAADPDVAASEHLAEIIKHGGGTVHQATPLPNTITATLPPQLIKAIATNALVAKMESAGPNPHLMSSPVDGSETWHTNGFTGNGTSADGLGGPDYAFPDSGARTTHLAFRTRIPGDPTSGPATGPSRITSPPGRVDFSGSEHGNTVAATVINTDLTVESGWRYFKGLAYGIDKVYDPLDAASTWHWLTGITYSGEPGVSDIPEAINLSQGTHGDTIDQDPAWVFMDTYVTTLGITFSGSAGNCGYQNTGFTNCLAGMGPHRVSIPSTNYNTISVGGIDYNGDIYNSGVWIPWAVSSPGPTWGGRKKPDLLAQYAGSAGGPNDQNDTTYENTGTGTSYAAPVASAGALLLASTGIYAPTAQKAILINSATQFGGRTYWTPKAGWGVIDLDQAFVQRANYANSTISPQGENGARFFRATGVASGDRSTLVWNRRTSSLSTYRALTNLDLTQHNQATGAITATGGSDAADTVDTDQTVTAENPMPGNGTDGGDNVEQVRSTSSGTQVLKVKALSAIDGAVAEPFSIASANPLTPLETPVPEVDFDLAPQTSQIGETVTVTADVTNSSSDIALTGAEVSLTPPAGVLVVSGNTTQSLGTLNPDATATAVWQVQGNSDGIKTLSAAAQGTAYGETFTQTGTADLTVDSTTPLVSVSGPGQWSGSSNPEFTWSATDDSGIASYDVSTSIGGGASQLLLDDTTQTSGTFTAPEGVGLAVHVTATDAAGNESASASATTTIDAIAPTVAIGAPVITGGTATTAIASSNVGSPVSTKVAFSPNASAPLLPLATDVVQFTNNTTSTVTAIVRATATDALGRAASASASVNVPSRWLKSSLKLRDAKSKAGSTAVSGTINKVARGRVTITAARVGKTGTNKRTAQAAIRSGKFSAKLRLAPGRYRIVASFAGTSTVLKGKATIRITVK